jgi:glycosyltransferase involved in cell wall biosynthesis
VARNATNSTSDQAFLRQGFRVLMLAPSYVPRLGGVEKHVRSVCRELARLGAEVRIATPRWEEGWAEQEVIDDVAVRRLDLSARAGRRELAPWVEWAEVVHTHDAYPFLKYYLPFRARRPRLPAFVTFHGYEGYPIPLEARLLRRLVLWLTRGNICAGAFIPKWYRFRCTHVTHGGVDAPAARPPSGEGAVFAGRLARDTGFLGALEAVRLLKEEHGVSLPLEVCGEGELRAEAERVVESASLEATFHGQVSDVMPYLRRARFAFVTGLLTMLEAMASGAIVLSLYDNPLKEDYLRLFPGARHAIISDSPAELARRAAELVASPDTLDAMAAEAYEFARTQTWGKVADLYVDLYQSAAGGGGAA